MQINFAVEPLVREAFAAAIGRDIDRSIAALQAMAKDGEDVIRDCVTLATAISSTALLDISGGQAPSIDELRQRAAQLVDMQAWANITELDAHALLCALAGHTDRSVLPPETYIRVIFAAGAWLLGAFGPLERSWYAYLDEILTRLETNELTEDGS